MITGRILFDEEVRKWKVFGYMIPSDRKLGDKYEIKIGNKFHIANTLDEAVDIYKKVIFEYSEDYKHLWGL
jgi:prefoldin subunit 5